MANDDKVKKQSGGKRKSRRGSEKNNFQDKFADREFEKGFKDGKKFGGGVCVRDTNNDPKWYFKDPKVLADVASFAFAHPLGDNMHFYQNEPGQVAAMPQVCTAVPGLMYISIGMTPGISVDAQSPLNLAAQDIYSFVRYRNSGGSNYDPPDLMMYLLGMDSLYAAWNWMKRIYGYASTYSQMNKYKPRAYAVAERVNLDDIYAHLADFRAYLNMAASRIAAFAVPAVMTYNIRHSWLFSNIFKDSGTTKAQEYMYVPAYFYMFQETASTGGTSLTPYGGLKSTSETDLWTFESLRTMLNNMINAMQYSEDAGIMSGDIIKAYGSNLFTLTSFDADYKVEAAYSKEVLTQIENCAVLRSSTTDSAQFNITQDPNTNYIKFQPTVNHAAVPVGRGRYLNFHWDNPSPEDVVVATRLMYTGMPATDPTQTVLTSVGSEFADDWGVVTLGYPKTGIGAPAMTRFPADFSFSGKNSAANEWTQFLANIWIWCSFDWAPAVIVSAADADDTQLAVTPEMKDWDIYTRLDNNDVEALNTLALLSEFNLPN